MITIVDYDAGNIRSVKRACNQVGIESIISKDPDEVIKAEKVIFPGVGAAASAMETLKRRGLDQAFKEVVAKGVPTLGICIGAQIILERSEESDTECLGLIPGQTKRFDLTDPSLKIPHIGWNGVNVTKSHPLLEGIENGDEFYFVHSYFPNPSSEQDIYAVSEYEKPFCCALGKDNLFATQFHPEKSGRFGLELLRRFSSWESN
ncbi:MAG: imidazole glycerol phosphate synthase subunit HisH [Proteobacteria bacterium]|nr:imidazole glycerol phosphate synthase subunit HisH [Pseudomonadota bacterium]